MGLTYTYHSFKDCWPLPGLSIHVRDPRTKKRIDMRGYWYPDEFKAGEPFSDCAEWCLLYDWQDMRYYLKDGKPWRATRREYWKAALAHAP